MTKKQFEILMYALYRNNQLFIPQGQTIQEWIDKAFDDSLEQVKNRSTPDVIECHVCGDKVGKNNSVCVNCINPSW